MKFGTRFTMVSALLFAMSVVLINPVQAVTVCTPGSVLFPSGGADVTTSTACEVHLGVNDSNMIGSSINPFGISDWVLAAKSDGTGGDGALSLSGVVNGSDAGTWAVDDFAGYTSVFLTLKTGNQFAAYLLDTNFLSGDWTTTHVFPAGKKGKSGKDLSHMSLYYSPGSLTVVPLPAALPLYGAGLVLMGFLGIWRKKKLT